MFCKESLSTLNRLCDSPGSLVQRVEPWTVQFQIYIFLKCETSILGLFDQRTFGNLRQDARVTIRPMGQVDCSSGGLTVDQVSFRQKGMHAVDQKFLFYISETLLKYVSSLISTNNCSTCRKRHTSITLWNWRPLIIPIRPNRSSNYAIAKPVILTCTKMKNSQSV